MPRPALPRAVLMKIGNGLREHYFGAMSAPMPERFFELLSELKAKVG